MHILRTISASIVAASFANMSTVCMAQTTQAPAGKDPRFWPTPVIDTTPPPLPTFKRERAVLIFSKTNGFRHDEHILVSNAALKRMAEAKGWDDFVSENAAVFNKDALRKFDVIVLNSTSGNLFTRSQRAAFREWLEGGGGLVALHGAGGDNRYDWRWYGDVVLGALFIGHPSPPKHFQQGTIHVVDREHPAMRKLPAQWTREEEWYAFDRVPSGYGTRILARLDESSYDVPPKQRMGDHPIIWTRCVGKGRVFYSALGHKPETYSEPLHVQMIEGALTWAADKNAVGCSR